MDRWIPLTQYAMEEGVSISTLRRKIKSNSIEYQLDNGRYLIKSDSNASSAPEATKPAATIFPRSSSDAAASPKLASAPVMVSTSSKEMEAELAKVSREMHASLAEMELKWRALEARLNGLSKKVDYLVEQNSELNMLVKVFEEKLDASL